MRSMVKVCGLLSTCIPYTSHDSNCRFVEGEWVDRGISDPLSDMFSLLMARRNHVLTQQWGVWLAGKDAHVAQEEPENVRRGLEHLSS